MEINITYPDGMTREEAIQYAVEETKLCDKRRKILEVEISLDGEEVVIENKNSGNIKRIRRITGYLAPIQSFNDAKQSELSDRYAHLTLDQRAIRE
jgi:anaerobic ribonucleoside-triphosphate reductase